MTATLQVAVTFYNRKQPHTPQRTGHTDGYKSRTLPTQGETSPFQYPRCGKAGSAGAGEGAAEWTGLESGIGRNVCLGRAHPEGEDHHRRVVWREYHIQQNTQGYVPRKDMLTEVAAEEVGIECRCNLIPTAYGCSLHCDLCQTACRPVCYLQSHACWLYASQSLNGYALQG